MQRMHGSPLGISAQARGGDPAGPAAPDGDSGHEEGDRPLPDPAPLRRSGGLAGHTALLLLVVLALFFGVVALAAAARLLVSGWAWAMTALGVPPPLSGLLAIAGAVGTALGAWALFQRLIPHKMQA